VAREIWATGGRTVCNSTRVRALPLFEVRWSDQGSVAYLSGNNIGVRYLNTVDTNNMWCQLYKDNRHQR
jgi:hypothetical protein